MTRILESHLNGHWQRGLGVACPLLDATTGAEVARIDATGLDLGAALDWGRRTGGPALRAMTLHQRALMLKALGAALMADKEALYDESYATGATRADSWIDIEGGIGTLLTYASRARRDLPNTPVLIEGAIEPLSRDDSFAAQHILTPLTGIAVHINAFNFPVWGMLEKLAPTLLAGMPALIKPASQTAYLTERVVRSIAATGILPPGALQLLTGSAGDLLDHVTGQDVVTFTGSAATGQQLRRHPAILSNAVRFGVEADSLNSAILGPDVTVDCPEFDLFIREITREMTVKSGQKCTAIRRVMVPRDRIDAVIHALNTGLAGIASGDPRAPETRMGPLVGLDQRDEVRARIAELTSGAEIVSRDIEVPSNGAFLAPVVLRCDAPHAAPGVHDIEAFGPVVTVMPYDSTEEAAALAALGKGSLVASVFTDDPEVAATLVPALGSHHGRILIGNRASAKSSTGHGSPLPMLVHGGPGRAGGGEELGGMRAVKHYMQRTAVQGTPRLLSAVTKGWSPGAATRDDRHPFRKPLSDLAIGDQLITAARQVTLADIEHFAQFTGDTFYAHMDEAGARANPFFDGRVAHGYLILSFAAGLFVDPDPGPVLANYGVDNLRFLTPVYPDDSLSVRLTCAAINPRETAEYGEVRWDCSVTNQRGEPVAQYDVLTMVAKTWP